MDDPRESARRNLIVAEHDLLMALDAPVFKINSALGVLKQYSTQQEIRGRLNGVANELRFAARNLSDAIPLVEAAAVRATEARAAYDAAHRAWNEAQEAEAARCSAWLDTGTDTGAVVGGDAALAGGKTRVAAELHKAWEPVEGDSGRWVETPPAPPWPKTPGVLHASPGGDYRTAIIGPNNGRGLYTVADGQTPGTDNLGRTTH